MSKRTIEIIELIEELNLSVLSMVEHNGLSVRDQSAIMNHFYENH